MVLHKGGVKWSRKLQFLVRKVPANVKDQRKEAHIVVELRQLASVAHTDFFELE